MVTGEEVDNGGIRLRRKADSKVLSGAQQVNFDAQEDTSRKWVTSVSLGLEKWDLPSLRAQAHGETTEVMEIWKRLR